MIVEFRARLKLSKRSSLLSVLLIAACAGCAPMGETPGVRLGGSSADTPDSFVFVKDAEVIQLSAKGRVLPRVVNIWGVGFPDAMYVWSDPGSGWARRVHERPNEVRVRVGDDVYELSASEVTDPTEREFVANAYYLKYTEDLDEMYGRPTTPEDFELLFRLVPRRP